MTEISIEKGVPLPKGRNKYPFANMQIGDSCFMPGANASRASTVTGHARKAGMKFTVRKWTEGDVAGVRVWRVS